MRLQPKLMILMLGSATVPLALAGLTSTRISENATRRQIREAHLRIAERLATGIDRDLTHRVRTLSLTAETFPLGELSAEERAGAVMVAYRQVEGLEIGTLLDRNGAVVVEPISLEVGQPAPGRLVDRSPRDAAARRRFVARVPWKAALEHGWAIGEIYDENATDGPRVAVAVSTASGDYVLAAELSLRALEQELTAFRLGDRGDAWLISEGGEVVVHRDASRVGTDLSGQQLYADLPGGSTAAANDTVAPWDNQKIIAARAPVPTTGWGVIVAQPSADAYVAARRLRAQSIFWLLVSLVLAAFLGVVYSRRLVQPVLRLADGARAFGKREFDHRVDVHSGDEIEDLAVAFNRMSEELAASITEIERWNEELSERVEARTRELAEAQAQLFQNRKLAAVGQLGAGVAHEINNPLTAVVGYAQMLLEKYPEDHPDRAKLQRIYEAGERCAQIADSMLRFSSAVNEGDWARVDVNEAIRDALTVRTPPVNVVVEVQLAEALPPVFGVSSELRTVAWHLIGNALTAMREGGTLTIRSALVDGDWVEISVADTGPGIPLELQDQIFDPFFTDNRATKKGLGLAETHRIVSDHEGEIRLESTPGQGARFIVRLPVLARSRRARAAVVHPEDLEVPGGEVAAKGGEPQ